ncbi:glycerophosphodiester phosphodiesterase family protein [Zhihengliuella salsuginis]|uniref:Glycerophosphoryl diester phosphodiesterase n=1 Tax=Zhihengliuella salsuginis TaxID=578222 RepID=A0ABQ3GJQ9_9MICC|nr:glycerophosphodiester phosphodiesterase family protein [Zhihengliuella salsuginis]GHD11145.1 glycerophosphoryl diester phosphodiesterase [Zhihengliuella salsuginis]
MTSRTIKAYAHRGYSPTGAENTLAAFRAAVERGFTHVETDVRTSADGVLMVFHDEHVDRLTRGFGRVSELTAEQLSRLRVAEQEPIATFEQLLTAFPGLHINVDLKDDAAVPVMAELLTRHAASDRVVVASFSDLRRHRFTKHLAERAMPPVRVTGGAKIIAAFTLLGLISRGRFQPWRLLLPILRNLVALQVPVRQGPLPVVTGDFVARAHEAGLEVHVWVVDDADTMRELLDLGVDAIMTDEAETLVEVYTERGIWPPTPTR